ncbi:hypothetical protein PMZ80_005112 [Knufia obscura]|uniref:BTB domain-containing protein n=1 Tax=Knufia obscura TaxID=1635080 RepID=A0ABR0RQ81_9EURO|nr:hypothetical protein PMZ80_005112 [Knufia obscura]
MAQYSQSGITTIVVGPEKKLFYVHTNLLRQKSEAFRAALSGKRNKGSDGESEIVLEDEDPDVVETIIDWIYHGTLPKLTTTKLNFSLCLLCYKFAETRMMYSLKNTIVDLLRKDYVQHSYITEATEVSKAYKLDLGNTQIGKFLLKSTVYKIMGNHMINKGGDAWEDQLIEACEDGELAKDIVKDVIAYRKVPYGAPYEGEGCFFHEHSDGSACKQ